MSHRNRWADRVILLTLVLLAGFASSSAVRAESSRVVSVPALAVSVIGGQQTGNVHYVALQLERDPQGRGPTILFSEASAGSAVDDVWKDGARAAIAAAAKVMGEDERNWRLTIKNRSRYSLSSGSSASSAIAVGIIAAWRGDTIRSGIVITGVIAPDGRIEEVGDLPAKLQGAAAANMRSMLVPKGEAKTAEWDLFELGQQRNINVVEVATLQEAYEFMTGIRP
ncbi:MAG: S16 family serine protease [Nitrospirota bacterium]